MTELCVPIISAGTLPALPHLHSFAVRFTVHLLHPEILHEPVLKEARLLSWVRWK